MQFMLLSVLSLLAFLTAFGVLFIKTKAVYLCPEKEIGGKLTILYLSSFLMSAFYSH